jgi:hypothetical protein
MTEKGEEGMNREEGRMEKWRQRERREGGGTNEEERGEKDGEKCAD